MVRFKFVKHLRTSSLLEKMLTNYLQLSSLLSPCCCASPWYLTLYCLVFKFACYLKFVVTKKIIKNSLIPEFFFDLLFDITTCALFDLKCSKLSIPHDPFLSCLQERRVTSKASNIFFLVIGKTFMAWRLTFNQHFAEDIFCSLKKVATLKYGFTVPIAHDLIHTDCWFLLFPFPQFLLLVDFPP